MNGKEYAQEQLISEGGYGYVYRVSLKNEVQKQLPQNKSELKN